MSNLDRRRFHELTAAAFGGLVAGSLTGCSGGVAPDAEGVARGELHLCRGLNDCKGKGGDGKNECRGQGSCATVKASSCSTQNACKGLGGCGENPGLNACKGKGGCHVPLMDFAWEKVRQRMESKWKEKSSPFGTAPAKREEKKEEISAEAKK